jgi:hypothetical protein
MALVQCVANDNAAGASTAVVNAGAGWVGTTAGSLIVVGIFWRSAAGAITSVTDSASNTYVSALAAVVSGNYSAQIWYFPNVGAGVTSVTVNMAATPAAIIFVAEESGIVTSSPVDGTPVGQTNASAATFDSGATTTSNANDVLYGWASSSDSTNRGYAASGSWAAVTGTGITSGHRSNTTDADDAFMERQAVSATGPYDATGTCAAATTTRSLVAAFKQPSAAVLQLMGQCLT